MSRSGIEHPTVIDLVTRKDDNFYLVLAETRALVDEDAIALQEKLNTYLSFAVDGGLWQQYPEANGKPVEIRVELYSSPEPFILEFLSRYAAGVREHGVSLSVVVNGQAVASRAAV